MNQQSPEPPIAWFPQSRSSAVRARKVRGFGTSCTARCSGSESVPDVRGGSKKAIANPSYDVPPQRSPRFQRGGNRIYRERACSTRKDSRRARPDSRSGHRGGRSATTSAGEGGLYFRRRPWMVVEKTRLRAAGPRRRRNEDGPAGVWPQPELLHLSAGDCRTG